MAVRTLRRVDVGTSRLLEHREVIKVGPDNADRLLNPRQRVVRDRRVARAGTVNIPLGEPEEAAPVLVAHSAPVSKGLDRRTHDVRAADRERSCQPAPTVEALEALPIGIAG